MYNWGIAEVKAIQAEKAPRLRLDPETLIEDDLAQSQSIRRRLATALVTLGVKIDPLAVEDVEEFNTN
ncbi:MAG TPA: hypothetical protein VI759_10920 [Dehalococcoidia bacterium]|nr:hypothetical protein [Dehalococcoidia bacterium]